MHKFLNNFKNYIDSIATVQSVYIANIHLCV